MLFSDFKNFPQADKDKNLFQDKNSNSNILFKSESSYHISDMSDASKSNNLDEDKKVQSQIDSTIQSIIFQEEEKEEVKNKMLQNVQQVSKNNISKNIIKAFFSYLLDKNNDLLTNFAQKGSSEQNAHKSAKNFVQSYNFNNNYLNKLIQHPKYGKALEFYLTFEAEIWLQNSKVKKKEDHLIYINFLKLCCTSSEYSHHLKSYKKTK